MHNFIVFHFILSKLFNENVSHYFCTESIHGFLQSMWNFWNQNVVLLTTQKGLLISELISLQRYENQKLLKIKRVGYTLGAAYFYCYCIMRHIFLCTLHKYKRNYCPSKNWLHIFVTYTYLLFHKFYYFISKVYSNVL